MEHTSKVLFSGAVQYLTHLKTNISALNDELYTKDSKILPGSTIGKHVRHVLDHFSLLLSAITADSSDSGCEVDNTCSDAPSFNYSHRIRNSSTENNVQAGILSISRVSKQLAELADQSIAMLKPVKISDTLTNGEDGEFMSSLGRELWFCTHHMVHHNAIMSCLFHEFGLEPPTGFAYAPSTVAAYSR